MLDFPNFDQTRSLMIVRESCIGRRGSGSWPVAHPYLHGHQGIEGAYEAMRYGYVDETYAKEHHVHWYEDVKSGKVRTETAEGKPEAPQVLHGAGS